MTHSCVEIRNQKLNTRKYIWDMTNFHATIKKCFSVRVRNYHCVKCHVLHFKSHVFLFPFFLKSRVFHLFCTFETCLTSMWKLKKSKTRLLKWKTTLRQMWIFFIMHTETVSDVCFSFRESCLLFHLKWNEMKWHEMKWHEM